MNSRFPLFFTAILVCGCGRASSIAHDVSDAPPSVSAARSESAMAKDDPLPASIVGVQPLGVFGNRFVVFQAVDHVIVRDVRASRTIAVAGTAYSAPRPGFIGEGELAPSLPANVALVSHTLLAAHDADGAFAFDLERHEIVARIAGKVDDVWFADDDRAFVGRRGETELVVAEMPNGAQHVLPVPADSYPRLEWHAKTVTLYSGDASALFDRRTWDRVSLPAGTIAAADAEGSVAVLKKGAISLWEPAAKVPRFRFTTKGADGVFVDAHVLAWADADDDYDHPRRFHVVDRATGASRVFTGRGRCNLYPEGILRVEASEIVTDVSCDPGCPSLPFQAVRDVYTREGAFLRTETDPPEPAPNDVAYGEIARLTPIAATIGVPLLELVPLPTADKFLVRRGDLDVVNSRGAVEVVLDESKGAVAPIASSDGAFVVAAFETDGAAIWSTATGARLFTLPATTE